jgi:hypothetical protein
MYAAPTPRPAVFFFGLPQCLISIKMTNTFRTTFSFTDLICNFLCVCVCVCRSSSIQSFM